MPPDEIIQVPSTGVDAFRRKNVVANTVVFAFPCLRQAGWWLLRLCGKKNSLYMMFYWGFGLYL
jgi:hypothetical protein